MARNSFFQFKQFRVEQAQCAMKVCTDACVFGAWVAIASARDLLDIGAGTGLLSLMAAQRNPSVRIDAVEIDDAAFAQATQNVAASPFGARISVVHSAIQRYEPARTYDTILVNPPFFQADLRSPDAGINGAHHAALLSFPELLTAVARLLKNSGTWHVLLPPDESQVLGAQAAEQGWTKVRELLLYHALDRRPIRVLTSLTRSTPLLRESPPEQLAIFEPGGSQHTFAFRELLQEFYLNF